MQNSLSRPYAKTYTISKYKTKLYNSKLLRMQKSSPIQLCDQFPESIEPHASSVYIARFSVVVSNLYHM